MRSIKILSITGCLLCGLLFADFFPVGGWRCERLYQADSCAFNDGGY